MRIKLSLLLAALMILPLLQAQASAPVPAVRPALVAVADETPTDRMIIKYKASADLSGSKAPAHTDRLGTLSAAAGVQLEYLREMSGDAHVLSLPDKLPLSEVRLIADSLMKLDDVEYAQPDYIMQPMGTTPDDPYYLQQWHYFETFGINAPAAWDITTGSSNIVIAVIDTGITNHADLAGRTVPGYDFITDYRTANDNDPPGTPASSRDSDPSDPGDWITSAEIASAFFAGCQVVNSSWHGTHVAGTIGAASNNSLGVAGINWVSKILPVRVLGKCGGYTDDIVDGMRWAAGMSVSGAPINANPAKVENMSLGGKHACDATTQSAINDITAAGSTVIVAAGNSNDNASLYSPASCNGVITVAATDRNGNRAYYSNYGSAVEISAPGGDTRYAGSGVLSTLNTGTQGPVADTYAFYQGTSMATPHVVGVASLMLSLSPSLTPGQVRQILQSTARPFPTSSTCNTSICGSGIVDAGAAVRASAFDVGIQAQVVGSNPMPGNSITFTLSISNAGGMAVSGVLVTDSIPSEILTPTYNSTIPITPTGVYSYVWDVGTLEAKQNGVITIYGQIDPNLPTPIHFINTASIWAAQDNTPGNNTSSVTLGEQKIYLPVVMRTLPPAIVSGDFESGTAGWTEFSTHGWPLIINSKFPSSVTPHSGSWAVWLGGEYSDISYIQQQVTVPSSSYYLAYWHWIASLDDCGYDLGRVLVNGAAVDTYDLCTSTNTGGWVKHVVNLSAYAGQSVSLQIRSETDDTLNSNLFVDDVSFQSSPSSAHDPTTLSNFTGVLPKSDQGLERQRPGGVPAPEKLPH